MKYVNPEMEIMLLDGQVIVTVSNSGEAGAEEGGGTVTPPDDEWL